MTVPIVPERANRLAIGLAKTRRIPYVQAEEILRTLTLRIVLDRSQAGSAAAQAALLTALNTSHRAFLGGVAVSAPLDTPSKLPIPGAQTLGEALAIAGYTPVQVENPSLTIHIQSVVGPAKDDDVVAHCDGWRGGASDASEPARFKTCGGDDFALGGILAGAMAVHRAFVRITRLPSRCLDGPTGISLWDPSADWMEAVADRKLVKLPRRFWILGLGHLGQAFLWNLALLPFERPNDVDFLLQDFDTIDESNHGSGLLCDTGAVGRKKTRHCAAWLERFGFSTTLVERPFSAVERCTESDPKIALCGFDRAAPRSYLETAGFGLTVECGLGGSLADFDQADLHVFPSARHTAAKLWSVRQDQAPEVTPAMTALFGADIQICGALAIDTAGKSVSTSFVGAMVGALAIAELLRTFNGGPRFDDVTFDARNSRLGNFLESTVELKPSEIASFGYMDARI